ncbi:hypothetical protein T05_3113 [Trichinella murrelli]|uniref:Uncharacterized protein n=1 Tax=Trichinella murrelli TaxID=144512 RepID=A0A0V0T7Q5_9BILA|nr:hypothetical protein T05_3113 [Trichinella murrelli]
MQKACCAPGANKIDIRMVRAADLSTMILTRGVRVSLEAQKGLQPAVGPSEHNFVKEVAIQEARRTDCHQLA